MSTAVLPDQSRKPAEPAAPGGLATQAAERRANRDALQALGINPYPTRFERSATLAGPALGALLAGPGRPRGRARWQRRRAGGLAAGPRQTALRHHRGRQRGRAADVPGRPPSGRRGRRRGALDLGDWIGADGEVITSRRGELSVDVTELWLLSKALRPLPDKWHGLTETDTRYRQREVDLLANPEAAACSTSGSGPSSTMRRLMERSIRRGGDPDPAAAGRGAIARPFFTHANALDIDSACASRRSST